jgi:hypothetical protein
MNVNFDTFKFVKRATHAGFTEEQAAFQAEEMALLLKEELATKKDIQQLEKDIEHIKNDIIIRLGTLMVVGMGLLGFILKH